MLKIILNDSNTAKSLLLFRIIGFCHFTVIKFLFCFSLSVFPLCRLQKQQQQQQDQTTTKQTLQQTAICSSNNKQVSSENRILSSDNKKSNDNDNDNNYDSTSGESDDDESVELWSNEIPVYVKGEQRWISGVTEQTTCLDIIEALLMDEGILKSTNDGNNNANGVNLYPTKVSDYVITERWRRMEQALDGRTKILKIWTAWGTEQSEVCSCDNVHTLSLHL